MKSLRRNSIPISIMTLVFCLFVAPELHLSGAFSQELEETASPGIEDAAVQPDETAAPVEQDSPDIPDMNVPINFPDYTRQSRRELVRFGGDQKVKAGETVQEMVTIFGSAEMAGRVERDMVTIFGDSVMTGSVGGQIVTIFGDVEINGPVDHDMVVVFGSLDLGPEAVLNGNCITIFGQMIQNPSAVVSRDAVVFLPIFSGLKDYIVRGPLMGRLIPPGSILAWIFVALHFVLYFLIALLLPKPTAAAVRQLDENPFLSFGVGLLTSILLAPLNFILMVTGIGIILMPLIGLAHIAFMVLGKTAVLEFFGFQILRRTGPDDNSRRILAFLIGFAAITIAYMIPILGLLIWFLLGPLALGSAVLAVFRSMRKNGNGNTAPGIPVAPASTGSGGNEGSKTVPPPPQDPASGTGSGATENAGSSLSSGHQSQHSDTTQSEEPTVMPRAGFWIRLAATALDAILLTWILFFTGKIFLLCWVIYHVAMWTWKGTTIGGIVCRLKVVRLDGRPSDFGVSLVRSLAAFFSTVALGLGFFWVAWSRDRQSWHDMIAGTVIVRVPQSIHLI